MRKIARSFILAMAISCASCALVATASASETEGLELLPTPTKMAPQSFNSAMGETTFNPASGSNQIRCTQTIAQGEFTSARRGTAQFTYTGCTITGTIIQVHTEGAKNGEMVSVTVPVYLTAGTSGSWHGMIINPDDEEGPPPTSFIPKIWAGSAVVGPITGSVGVTVSPVNTKVTEFTLAFRQQIYRTSKGTLKTTVLKWKNFGGVEESIGVTSKGTAKSVFGQVEFKTIP